MSFVHCNQCFCRPSTDSQFFITSCGHLFCGRCVSKDPILSGHCVVCKKTQVTRSLINSAMKPETREYFSDPLNLVKKLTKVITFQKSHMERYLSHSEIERKKLKAENIRYEKKLAEMEQMLKNSSMGQRIKTEPSYVIQQPIPTSQGCGSQMMQRSQNVPRSYAHNASQPASMMKYGGKPISFQSQYSGKPAGFQSTEYNGKPVGFQTVQYGGEPYRRSDDSVRSSQYYTPQSGSSSIINNGLMGTRVPHRISIGPRSSGSGPVYGMYRRPLDSVGASSSGKDMSIDYMSARSAQTPIYESYLKKRATVSPYGR